jgi:hypothetical protein
MNRPSCAFVPDDEMPRYQKKSPRKNLRHFAIGRSGKSYEFEVIAKTTNNASAAQKYPYLVKNVLIIASSSIGPWICLRKPHAKF